MRADTFGAFALIALTATGCATPPTAPPSIVLRVVDGPLWIYADEVGRFTCERGPLACERADGRLSLRRCRCLE